MAPTLITSYYVQISPQGTSALVTPSFTPSNGEVLVVKLATWDTGSPLGAPTGGSQTYMARVTNAPGGFNEWCSIYTAVISGSPGSMTVSSTPSVSLRGSMVVERWSGAQLAASPVTNSANGFSSPAASTITPSSGSSIITWVAGDASSVDPATRAYLASATQDGLRDDHVGANGVDYHAYQSSTGTGSQSYGLSLPTGMTWVIAAIEVQSSGGAAQTTTPQPLVVSTPRPAPAYPPILIRNTAAPAVPAAKGVSPLVVTSPVPAPAGTGILRRSTLADPPVLTTPSPYVVARPQPTSFSAPVLIRTPITPPPGVQPLVVTQPVAQPAAAAILVRNSQAPAVQAPAATPAPIVVTSPSAAPAVAALLIRGTLVDPPVFTTPSPMVVTARVAGPVGAAIVVRNPQAPVVAPATATPQPIVVTAAAVAPPSRPLLQRSTLADPPVLTTLPPLVVTAPAQRADARPILLRNPQPAAAAVSGPSTAPIVVTAPQSTPRGLSVLIRSVAQPQAVAFSSPSPELFTRSRTGDRVTRSRNQNLTTSTHDRDLEA